MSLDWPLLSWFSWTPGRGIQQGAGPTWFLGEGTAGCGSGTPLTPSWLESSWPTNSVSRSNGVVIRSPIIVNGSLFVNSSLNFVNMSIIVLSKTSSVNSDLFFGRGLTLLNAFIYVYNNFFMSFILRIFPFKNFMNCLCEPVLNISWNFIKNPKVMNFILQDYDHGIFFMISSFCLLYSWQYFDGNRQKEPLHGDGRCGWSDQSVGHLRVLCTGLRRRHNHRST